jgi:hypothetical protein
MIRIRTKEEGLLLGGRVLFILESIVNYYYLVTLIGEDPTEL